MNQSFYNIAGGIENQIRREKRTTISEVIVRVKRMQNRNWFYFEFSFESSSFTFKTLKTEKFKLTFEGWIRPVCHLFGFTRVSFCQNLLHSTLDRDGADAESPFPLFFSFSASFKNSSPREKVGNCLRFGTGGWSLFFIHFGREISEYFSPRQQWPLARKRKILAKRFARAIRVHYRDLEHAYVCVYWIWLRGSASYVIISFV